MQKQAIQESVDAASSHVIKK